MIELNAIKKSYGKIQAVRDCTLKMDSGKIHGLIGPNGAGKTTIMKIIAGILYFDEGSIHADSQTGDYIHWSRQNVIYIPGGDRGLRLKNTAYDNILNYGILKGVPKRRIEEQIEQFSRLLHMKELMSRRAEQLSMGEKKKTAILCAICSGMSTILLDEPSVGVDIDSIEELKEILKMISKITRTTLVISSHDISFLSDIAQKYAFIINGEVNTERCGYTDSTEIIRFYRQLIGGGKHETDV